MSTLKPTAKQLLAFKESVENGGNISQAMKDAGYSPATVNNPSNLTDSDGWEILLETFIPDEKLAIKLDEGLDSNRTISTIKGTNANGATTDFIDVPDFATRHKYLETALKLKQRLIERKDITSDGKPLVDINKTLEKIYGPPREMPTDSKE